MCARRAPRFDRETVNLDDLNHKVLYCDWGEGVWSFSMIVHVKKKKDGQLAFRLMSPNAQGRVNLVSQQLPINQHWNDLRVVGENDEQQQLFST